MIYASTTTNLGRKKTGLHVGIYADFVPFIIYDIINNIAKSMAFVPVLKIFFICFVRPFALHRSCMRSCQ